MVFWNKYMKLSWVFVTTVYWNSAFFSEISLRKQDLSVFYYLFHHWRQDILCQGLVLFLPVASMKSVTGDNLGQRILRYMEWLFLVLSTFVVQRDITKQCKLKGAGFQMPAWQMAILKWLEPFRDSVVYWTGILLNSASPRQRYWHRFTRLIWVQIYLGILYATLSILLKSYLAGL